MKLFRPITLLKDEYIAAVNPPLAPLVSECWNRRLNFYNGRTLTHTALNTEQGHRSSHLWMYGRTLSPGIVWGLRAGLKVASKNEFIVEPGLGITCQGETVSLPVPLHVAVNDLPMTVTVDDSSESNHMPQGVGIIVLQPIVADDAGLSDSTDQCEIDPADDAFADWRLIDGCRLVFVPWPWPDEPKSCEPSDKKFRNYLANTIFNHEAQLKAGEYLPWEKDGVPLGLLSINETGNIEFIDRYAVVRQGGAPLAGQSLVTASGTPFLWQAKVQVFIDHIQDLLDRGESLATLKDFVRFLPPVGILPAEVMDFKNTQTDFFPTYYGIQAVPIPLEQFEVALDACASMASFDLYREDKVKILVPVPQELYEPQLLQVEKVDPLFQQTIDTLLETVNLEKGKRLVLRDMGMKVEGAIDKDLIPVYPDPDPDEIPGEGTGETGNSDNIPYGYDYGNNTKVNVQSLYTWLTTKSPLSKNECDLIHPDNLGKDSFIGIKPFIDQLDEKINSTNDTIDFGFLRLQTDIYRVRQVMMGATEATRLATSPVLATIAKGVSSYGTQQDLKNYFTLAKQTQTSVSTASENTDTSSGSTSGSSSSSSSGTSFRSTSTVANISLTRVASSSAKITSTASQISSALYRVIPQESLKNVSVSAAAAATSDDITQQSPLIGEPREFRTTTIAERIAESPGPEAKSYAVATKAAVIGSLAALPINVANLDVTIGPRDVAILNQDSYDNLLHKSDLTKNEQAVVVKRVRSSTDTTIVLYLGPFTDEEREQLGEQEKHLREVLDSLKGKQSLTDVDSLSGMIAAGMFDPDPADGDEAAFLSVGIAALENTAAALRRIEGHINGYKQAKVACEKTLTLLMAISSDSRKELSEVDGNIAELRHDITVARALLEEETARIDAINNRRSEILTNHVPFIGFARLRTVSLKNDVPAVQLQGIYQDPIPACLSQDRQAPEELRNMLALLRDVPLKWLLKIKQLVLQLNHPSMVRNAFEYAKQRAQLQTSVTSVLSLPQTAIKSTSSTYGQTVNKMLLVYKQTAYTFQQQRATLNLSMLETMTWKETVNQAQNDLSLADLIEAGKERAALAQKATQEMEKIENVATCFYTLCGNILPVVRLKWAEKISEFDQPVSLRHLDALPGWSTVGFELRRDLQRLVDWLFLCIDPNIPDAVSFMNDLVRVCILLACHAPVSLIINGHVPKATTGKIGDIIDLVMDKGKITIGMQAAVLSGTTVAVQGIVEDISNDAARVKVTQSSSGPSFTIAEGAKAKFYMPGSVAQRLS